MSLTGLPLRGALWVSTFLLLISLGIAAPNNAYMTGPLPARAQMKLNKHYPCVTSFDKWNWLQPDKCIPIKGTGFQSLEVIKPWPVCKNGTDALFATFDTQSGTCDPELNSGGTMQRLLTRSDILFKCVELKDIGSFAFWCDGATPLPNPVDMTKEGALIKYPTRECDILLTPEYHLPDTCIELEIGLGLEFVGPAVCANGTKALVASFKGNGCDPTNEPLHSPFFEWDDNFIGICSAAREISSMSFWCDGLPGVDMRKPNPQAPSAPQEGANLGLILSLSLGLGGTFFIIVGLVAAYNINYQFRMKVKEIFNSGDGYIAL